MGKTKPFIDKKNASTYHVLHRSQRDVSQHVLNEGDTDAAGFILWPAEGNHPDTDKVVLGHVAAADNNRMVEWREKLKQAGLLDDRQEREQYMKEISGTGTFLSASGKIGSGSTGYNLEDDPRHESMLKVDVDMLEVKNQLENIPLLEALDEEVAAILYGDTDDIDFDQYEELNDDYVLDAAREMEDDDDSAAFDYDAHIQKLLDKARQERYGTNNTRTADGHEWAQRDQDFFAKANALREDYDDDSFANIPDDMIMTDDDGILAPKLNAEEERALCEKFEETLLEYGSDEIGDNPDEEIEGRLPLEGDEQIESALDDYLQEKEDEIFMKGRHHVPPEKMGGTGFSALVGTRMVSAKLLDQEGTEHLTNPPAEPLEVVLAKARERLAEPPLKPPAEDILIDGQSYFSERVRNPFDCESILSTYSNLDNNPTTIQATGKRSKKKNKNETIINEEEEELIPKIQLSNKTGLPLGVLPCRHSVDDKDDDGYTGTTMSVNKGVARNRKETAEEKRVRKARVKEERLLSRIQKKVTREVFQEEFAKHSVHVGGDAVAGKPVFRYS